MTFSIEVEPSVVTGEVSFFAQPTSVSAARAMTSTVVRILFIFFILMISFFYLFDISSTVIRILPQSKIRKHGPVKLQSNFSPQC